MANGGNITRVSGKGSGIKQANRKMAAKISKDKSAAKRTQSTYPSFKAQRVAKGN